MRNPIVNDNERRGDAANATAAETSVRQVLSLPAFASRIDGYQVPDAVRLNAALLETGAAWRAGEAGMASSNYLGWHSPRDLFERPEPAFRLLCHHIRGAAMHSLRRYWPGFDPARNAVFWEGWVNVNGPGAMNAPHEHRGNHLSGVYYVAVPRSDNAQSGAITFLNPVGALAAPLPSGETMVKTALQMPPTAGQMLVFPSYLLHWVQPNEDAADRVSIAFNLKVIS